MGEFHRSPSKVWWMDDDHNLLMRRISASPGSQDSGFSDTESTPPVPRHPIEQRGETSNNILKNISEEDNTKSQNLNINFKQKSTPNKSITLQLSSHGNNNKNASLLLPRTPDSRFDNKAEVQSEPTKRHRFRRSGSLKISRSLFKSLSKERTACIKDSAPKEESYQYAGDINGDVDSQCSCTNSKVAALEHSDSKLWKLDGSGVELPGVNKTFPLINENDISHEIKRKLSAPSILLPNFSLPSEEKEETTSDCESELESAFHGLLGHPEHTSTPKISRYLRNMKQNRSKRAMRFLTATRSNEKRSLFFNVNGEPKPVQKWLEEARGFYEPECTTTLQSKSIFAELAQKVAFIANRMTAKLRYVLSDSDIIIKEFNNIKDQKQHTGPLAQSFARLIEEFLQKYSINDDADKDILKLCESIRHSTNEDTFKSIIYLNNCWETTKHKIIVTEVKSLVNELEDPASELHVRASVTGITSIALRNKEIIDLLIANNSIHILCVLCEKCESSTVRSLVLRALSTICNNNSAIRQFEIASGIHLICDIISDYTRPEPERSEAVALLAQVTAPWIEDNRNVKGLQQQIKMIVKALTHFISSTKCCQNLLLCTAALANLTDMEPTSIDYIIRQNSIRPILKVIKLQSSLVSVYLLEQTATLIANLSLKVNSRQLLTEEHTPAALLHFLHYNCVDQEVNCRLQQKSVIALSRLSTNPVAAQQIVDCDGVERLVRLCRERKERHDSDAVLVAALATLRKIAEACGNSVINVADLQELVEPKLLDSFLAYSTQNESYV